MWLELITKSGSHSRSPSLRDIPRLTDVNKHKPVTMCPVSGCMDVSLSMRELTSDLKPSLRLTQLRPAQEPARQVVTVFRDSLSHFTSQGLASREGPGVLQTKLEGSGQSCYNLKYFISKVKNFVSSLKISGKLKIHVCVLFMYLNSNGGRSVAFLEVKRASVRKTGCSEHRNPKLDL